MTNPAALTGMAFRGVPRVLLPSRDFLICSPSARLARDGSRYVVANRQAPARPEGAHTVTAVLIPPPQRFQWLNEADTALPTMLCAARTQVVAPH